MQRQRERDNGGRVRTATNLYRNLCVNYEKIPLPGASHPLSWVLLCSEQTAPLSGAVRAGSVLVSPGPGTQRALYKCPLNERTEIEMPEPGLESQGEREREREGQKQSRTEARSLGTYNFCSVTDASSGNCLDLLATQKNSS